MCGAVGYPEVLSNADHLLVSVLTWVLLVFLAKMEILTAPDIWALLAVSPTSSSGDMCSQQGWCPVSRSEEAQSSHVLVKHSISKDLSATYCFNNPSLLLRAFWPKCWLLLAGLIIA